MADGVVGEVDAAILDTYEINKRIGKGAYGIVWRATHKFTGETVAVKKIYDAFRNKTDAKRTYREVMFLRQFGCHLNVIKLFGIMKAENDLDLYLILEYMDSDLHDVIKRENLLKDVHRRYIMYQLLSALKCLHSLKVIHRDLKPSNVLINSDCRIRVADFGLARSLSQVEEDDQGDPTLTEYVATRWYRAPEILLADKLYTTGVDMWSLGCILGEMLLGNPLFPGTSTLNQIERIMCSIAIPTSQDITSMCSGYSLSVLERASNRPKRSLKSMIPNASEDALDILSNFLVFNPGKRLSAHQALSHRYISSMFGNCEAKESERCFCSGPTFAEVGQLEVDEYRQKLYQLIIDTNALKKSKICNGRSSTTADKMTIEPENTDAPDPEIELVVNGGDPEKSPSKGSPPKKMIGRWISPESTSPPHPGLRGARSQESHRTSPSKDCPARTKPSTIAPSRSVDDGFLGLPAAGLPSHHPKASATSPWLRYHGTIIFPVTKDNNEQNAHKKQFINAKAAANDRLRPNYGRRQFGNYSNTSSLGSPRAAMQSYAQNHGTITASAFRQLRLGH